MSLNPDDPRPPYVQVAGQLRAAILRGAFKPGDRLPSQSELVARYELSRQTVANSLRELVNEGLVVSRKGSGMYVRERSARPVELRPHIDAAFDAPNVTLDFAGFTSETLNSVLQEPLDRVRDGRVNPLSIEMRLLLAAPPTGAVPTPVDADRATGEALARRTRRLTERHALAVQDSVTELQDLGLVASATVQIRTYVGTPTFKAYVINGDEMFFGFYPVATHDAKVDGEPTSIHDVMGKDATLMHYAANNDPDSPGAMFIEQAQAWFESVWTTVATEYQP